MNNSRKNGPVTGVRASLGVLALLAGLALTPLSGHGAVFEPRNFPSELAKTRYEDLVDELRCLVCQNQNIADSDADLARDLRDKVYELIMDGRSDIEIVDYMVQRYGDFVLYRPPVKAVTLGLWLGPALFLLLGGAILVVQVRRQSRRREAAISDAERAQLEAVLNEDRRGKP